MTAQNIIALTEENFRKEVLESAAPILVDFSAEWCGPCKFIAPILDELAEEFNGRVKVGKVDIDQARQLAVDYSINSVPTLLFFKQGQVVHQVVGAGKTRRELKAIFEQVAA
jgi:thioredoxin 1